MTVLLDTNVLVDLWRQPFESALDRLPMGRAAICGVTRAELLQGARSATDKETINRRLRMFIQIPITEDLWGELGDILACLRRQGISVPFPDALISTVALHEGIALWTNDSHFGLIQRAFPNLDLYIPTRSE
ncbi:MAG: tRNA(fMet)-specific endonuclease VapC [bacterium]|nr:tRNA(fMet)-specific endonuclease VapC [bacterium]